MRFTIVISLHCLLLLIGWVNQNIDLILTNPLKLKSYQKYYQSHQIKLAALGNGN